MFAACVLRGEHGNGRSAHLQRRVSADSKGQVLGWGAPPRVPSNLSSMVLVAASAPQLCPQPCPSCCSRHPLPQPPVEPPPLPYPAALPPDPRSTVAPLRPPIPPTRPHSNPMVGAAVNRPDVAAASRLSPVGPTGDRCSFGRLIMLAPHPPPCPTSTPTHCPALPPVRLLSHATPPHDTPPHDTSLRLP